MHLEIRAFKSPFDLSRGEVRKSIEAWCSFEALLYRCHWVSCKKWGDWCVLYFPFYLGNHNLASLRLFEIFENFNLFVMKAPKGSARRIFSTDLTLALISSTIPPVTYIGSFMSNWASKLHRFMFHYVFFLWRSWENIFYAEHWMPY